MLHIFLTRRGKMVRKKQETRKDKYGSVVVMFLLEMIRSFITILLLFMVDAMQRMIWSCFDRVDLCDP